MKRHYTVEIYCPHCNAQMMYYEVSPTSGSNDGAHPRHNDFCACTKCGNSSRYQITNGEIKLRKTTPEDIEQLTPAQQIELLRFKERVLGALQIPTFENTYN